MSRRSYGSGSLYVRTDRNGAEAWYAHWRQDGRQLKRLIGPKRTAGNADGLTKTQAEARLRDVMESERATAPTGNARTLAAAYEAWLLHLEATGAKASSLRAYRAAMSKWFLPDLGDRSLDRIKPSDVEAVMLKMRGAGLSDKSIRNYVGVLRACLNYAADRKRRWTTRNAAADVDLPKAPTYADIRYLTTDEVWLLVDHVAPGPWELHDQAMYLTAAMSGLRIGELQALEWRNVDYVHARIRVGRTWDRKTKEFTKPKSRRSERAVPMPDEIAGLLDRLSRAQYPDLKEPPPAALVFGDTATGEPLGHRAMYGRLRDALAAAHLDEEFGFHNLRHSYGTALAAQGVAMRTLQEWMGHQDIQTTQRYADYCPNPNERDVVAAAFSRGSNRGSKLTESEGTQADPR